MEPLLRTTSVSVERRSVIQVRVSTQPVIIAPLITINNYYYGLGFIASFRHSMINGKVLAIKKK